MHVDAAAFLPGVQRLPGKVDHDGGVADQPRTLEGRLSEAALTQPEIALAGDEAIAKHRLVHAGPEVLDVIAGVGYQHLLDQVGMVDKIDLP